MIWIKKHIKEIIINSIIVAGSIMFALLIGEGALRIFVRPPGEISIVSDDILAYRALPGNGWDQRGYRNTDALENADIVVIGDSQTYGNNAEAHEAWPQALGELSGRSVYQMAIGGYGPVQYSYVLDKALELDPEIIFVGLYAGNDLFDAYNVVYGKNLEYWAHLKKEGDAPLHQKIEGSSSRLVLSTGLDPDSWQMRFLEIRSWIRNHSRIYALLGDATRGMRERLGLAATFEEKGEKVKELSEERSDLAFVYDAEPEIQTIMSPQYRYAALDLHDEGTREGMRITKKLLGEMSEKAEAQGVSFVVVFIPTKERVYGTYLANKGIVIPASIEKLLEKEEEVTNVLLTLCQDRNLQCIEVLSDLALALEKKIKVYGSSFDGHPLASGYAVLAQSVYDAYIAEEILQPSSTTISL